MRKLRLSVALAISMGAGMSAFSQSAAPTVDPAWKAPEVIEFIGLKKGDKVAEIVGGRLTASLAQAVGPSGKVYAVETAATETVHRIDPARVKTDVLAAGFKLDAESSILANKDDDHTKNVFDPSVRGHTDQFLYRFKKPK